MYECNVSLNVEGLYNVLPFVKHKYMFKYAWKS